MTVCPDDETACCPLSYTAAAEQAINLGCLPSEYEIIQMRVQHGKTWACHRDPEKPCSGGIRVLRDAGLPYHVIDSVLATEQTGWPKIS